MKGIPSYEGVTLTPGKSAGGSTGARFAEDSEGGKWLIKAYRATRSA